MIARTEIRQEERLNGSAGPGVQRHGANAIAEAFFLGGVGNDDPEFEDLSLRVASDLRLIPVDYPDAGARGAVLSNMRLTAEVVVADILQRQPTGGIALVGYSFGGSLGLEVAHQLILAGRTVTFLGVLDAPFRMEELSGLFEKLRLATTARRAVKTLVQAAAHSEVTLRIMSTAAAPSVVGPNRAEPVRRALLTHLRTKALAGWAPPTCASPGLLVSTGVLGEANRDRWLSLCPNLSPLHVGGEHESLLTGSSLDAISVALIAAVQGMKPVALGGG